jgi:predicted transcriptional regulator
MTTKTLKLAMDKAAELPRYAQDAIAREVLERVSAIEQTKAELRVGIRELDAGLGQPADVATVLRRARHQHESQG